jgi:MFS transporter, DHA1 family, multidrug resistance protein
VSAPAALLARYTEPGKEGAVYGLDNSVLSGGRTIGPLLGSLIAAWLGLRAAFAFMIVLYSLIVLVAAVLLPKQRPLSQPEAESAPITAGDLQPEMAGD